MALRKILVVEDRADLAETIQRQLEHIGLTSAVATTGLAALRKVREEKPDLLLVDLILPDISGLDVGDRLKAEDSMRSIPILAMTDMSPGWENCLKMGFDGYLLKPFSHHELKQEIEKFLR
jgi:two-component system alkaline phosphatase synthesis response regulator PhoP